MKIDAINYNAFTGTAPVQVLKAEESNSSLDEYDETRLAVDSAKTKPVENPIEKKQGSVEDLMNLQKSTEKMAQSYGFANIAEAKAATSPASQASSTESTSAVSAVSSASSNGINA